jgi:anti-sigma regulatory factor (Ser/Thr protein kinase)
MAMASASLEENVGGYRHEAFLYSGMSEFLTGTMSFIRRAVNAGDPILVVVSGSKIDILRRELGAEAESVTFADMADVGGNPARIIAAWQAFVQAHSGAAQLWGLGEPVGPGRSPTELAECQLHEALLNVAFDASTPFWLLCPYDLEALTADVIDEAHRTHPFVVGGEEPQACRAFRPIDAADPFARPLPARPPAVACVPFEAGGLRRLRAFVSEHARRKGLDQESSAALVQAVNEVATNSLRHGGGRGELCAWSDSRSLICEVTDQGHITSPLVGRLPAALNSGAGGGLWLANQLCDLVQIYSSPDGTAIRVCQDL